jgi:cytochrome c-type biogenesis protein CcmH
MSLFYLGSALLFVLALGFIIWPLLSKHIFNKRSLSSVDLRVSTNVALYRDHLADIEQSLASGNINQAEYDLLKVELERNLLEDSRLAQADNTPQAFTDKSYLGVCLFLGVLLLAASVTIYSQLGAYTAWQVKTALDTRSTLEEDYAKSPTPQLQAQILSANRQLISLLESYISQSPEDLPMRALLARTAIGLGEYSLAIEHFQGILVQEPELSQIMAELAQAVFLQADNRVVPIVQSLVDETLKREPNNTIALGLAGIGAFQSENYQQAIDLWQQAIQLQGPRSANSMALQRGISAARQRLGLADDAVAITSNQGAADQERVSASNETANNDVLAEPEITVFVSIAEGINVAPETTVFIYARAWQGAKVPLSIARLQVSQLPTRLTLTNAMSMAPGMNLNSAKNLELVARISASGSPVPQSGDWQVVLGPIESSAKQTQAYSLLIADQVP